MTSPRRGFTLVELLVVIAIIGILVGLLLPAIQKVRAAAARSTCGNNLHQIGLALHQYHEAHGTLPPGTTSKRPDEPFPRMSWLTRLLPQLEQEQLWKATVAAYDLTAAPFVDPPHLGLSMPIKVFVCPEDGRGFTPQTTHKKRRVALTSYVGILGTDYTRSDGVLFLDSRIRLTDITDGTSNTIAAGERPPSADSWYGWWYAGHGQSNTGSADMLLGARELNHNARYAKDCPSGPYHFQAGRLDQQCDLFHFWSTHSGGGNFLFADGSARFLPYTADAILPALATRSGGEAVELP